MYIQSTGRLMMIDVPADTLLDTVTLNSNAGMLTLNSDLTAVVLQLDNDRRTYVYNAITLELDTVLDYYGYFHFDRVRHLGVVVEEDDIVLIDGQTFQERGRLSLGLQDGQIDTLNGFLYSAPDESSRAHWLYRVDYVNGMLLDSIPISYLGNDVSMTRFLPIPQDNRLYCSGILGTGPTPLLFIMRIDSLTVLKVQQLGGMGYPRCDLRFDSVRRKVYAGEPGQEFYDIPPGPGLFVFNVDQDSLVAILSAHVSQGGYPKDVPLRYFVVVPESRYLYAIPEWNYPILRYDMDAGFMDDTLRWQLDEAYPWYPNGAELGAKI